MKKDNNKNIRIVFWSFIIAAISVAFMMFTLSGGLFGPSISGNYRAFNYSLLIVAFDLLIIIFGIISFKNIKIFFKKTCAFIIFVIFANVYLAIFQVPSFSYSFLHPVDNTYIEIRTLSNHVCEYKETEAQEYCDLQCDEIGVCTGECNFPKDYDNWNIEDSTYDCFYSPITKKIWFGNQRMKMAQYRLVKNKEGYILTTAK